MSKPTVLYNGSCPVCRSEIRHYQVLDDVGEPRFAWQDIGTANAGAVYGVGADALRRRLHVVDDDGRLLVGVPAFARIWQELPRYRWLARLVQRPLVNRLTSALYEPLAAGLYAWDRRRRATTDRA